MHSHIEAKNEKVQQMMVSSTYQAEKMHNQSVLEGMIRSNGGKTFSLTVSPELIVFRQRYNSGRLITHYDTMEYKTM